MMEEREVHALLERYRRGLCTEEERQLVERWIDQEVQTGSWDRSPEERDLLRAQMKHRIDAERDRERDPQGDTQPDPQRDPQRQTGPRTGPVWLPWLPWTAAAAVIIALGISFYLYRASDRGVSDPHPIDLSEHDVAPGGPRATLQLSDGRTIDLTQADTGTVAGEAGLRIVKAADGQLVYTLTGEGYRSGGAASHTITTPNGGQYQLLLPDGTRVWLNAGSSLTYPSHFAASGREVALSGEAYFEVASLGDDLGLSRVPFVVHSNGQRVEVLGTHFNVSAYPADPVVTTTLLEGRVRVVQSSPSGASGQAQTPHSVILKPGQQALTAAFQPIEVKNTSDAEVDIAWKNGDFKFNGDLESIMQRIARWYNVDIYFEDSFDENTGFLGKVSRNRNLSSVLKILESSGKVRFTIVDGQFGDKERRIIVMK